MLQVPEDVFLAGKVFWATTKEARCCSRLGCAQAERLGAHLGSLDPPAMPWTTAVGLKIGQPAIGTTETAHA